MGEEAGKPGQIADAMKQALPKQGTAKTGAAANKQADTANLVRAELKKMGVNLPNFYSLDYEEHGGK